MAMKRTAHVGLCVVGALVVSVGCSALAGFEPIDFGEEIQADVVTTTADAGPEVEDGSPSRDADVVTVGDRSALDATDADSDASRACPSTRGRPMRLVRDYCIDANEVTNADYQEFVADQRTNPFPFARNPACSWKPAVSEASVASEPAAAVGNVDWCDALAYCQWAGKRLCASTTNEPVPKPNLENQAKDVWFRACTSGDPQLLNIDGNKHEWEDACDGTTPAAKCAARGTFVLDKACGYSYEPRNTRLPSIGIRCCR
jgi:hypothetical protein